MINCGEGRAFANRGYGEKLIDSLPMPYPYIKIKLLVDFCSVFIACNYGENQSIVWGIYFELIAPIPNYKQE